MKFFLIACRGVVNLAGWDRSLGSWQSWLNRRTEIDALFQGNSIAGIVEREDVLELATDALGLVVRAHDHADSRSVRGRLHGPRHAEGASHEQKRKQDVCVGHDRHRGPEQQERHPPTERTITASSTARAFVRRSPTMVIGADSGTTALLNRYLGGP